MGKVIGALLLSVLVGLVSMAATGLGLFGLVRLSEAFVECSNNVAAFGLFVSVYVLLTLTVVSAAMMTVGPFFVFASIVGTP